MTTSASDNTNHTEPPLWSIGFAVIVILVTPLILYSLAPTAAIRETDTVFSEGQQQVQIRRPATGHESKDDTCLLDPNSPLIVLHAPTTEADDSFIAEVQGNPADEWPFCAVHTEVLLKAHQVFQNPPVFGMVRDLLTRLF